MATENLALMNAWYAGISWLKVLKITTLDTTIWADDAYKKLPCICGTQPI